MITTEAEAVRNWCCSHKEEKCCATTCMAWRWHGFVEQREAIGLEPARTIYWEPNPKFHGSHVGVPERRGYCGLAGKPE